MSNEALADELKRLFIHRYDAHIIVDKKIKEWKSSKKQLSDKLLHQHLNGEVTVGSYCPDIDSDSKILMFDIDDHKDEKEKYTSEEIPEIIKKITTCLIKSGLHPYLEKSGMNNGHHIWVSLYPTPAKNVRNFGNHILKELNFDKLGIEIFPKVDEINEKTPYGVGYKLPLGKHRTTDVVGELLFKSYEKKSDFIDRGDRTLVYMKKVKPETLPDIPDDDEEIIKESILQKNRKERNKSIVKHKESNKISNSPCKDELELKLTRAKTCQSIAYHQRIQLNGSEGHLFRLYTGIDLVIKNTTDCQLHEFYKTQTDYDYKITQKNITEIRHKQTKKGDKFKPVRCRTMRKDCKSIVEPFCKMCEMKRRINETIKKGEDIKPILESCFICDTKSLWKVVKEYGEMSNDKKFFNISRIELIEHLCKNEQELKKWIIHLKERNLIDYNNNGSESFRIKYKGKRSSVIIFKIREMEAYIK